MKIGILGHLGIIGKALYNWLSVSTEHNVVGYDIADPKKNVENMNYVDAVFMCLPAPTLPSRRQDLSAIKEALELFKSHQCPFFIRSTVLPGTCDRLTYQTGKKIYSVPEFLTEVQADKDVLVHQIIAGTNNSDAGMLLQKIFSGKTIHQMQNMEAELAKYTHNTLGLWKVVYSNAIKALCLRLKIDYEKVLKGYDITPFFTRFHTIVPGHHGYGAAGKCLPKDASALISLLQDQMVPCNSFKMIESENQFYRDNKHFNALLSPEELELAG